MYLPKRIKLLIGAVILLVIGLIVWQVALYVSHRGLVKVNIAVVPSDSTLTINGKFSNPGTFYLKPGSYKLIASRQYFDDDVKSINTVDVDSKQVIYMLPGANSDKAKEYLANHPDIQRDRESAGGAEEERIRQLTLKKYPFLQGLPQENLHYKIDYSLSDNQKPELQVTLYPIINGPSDYPLYLEQAKQYKQEALNYLKNKGAKPADYKITFTPDLP